MTSIRPAIYDKTCPVCGSDFQAADPRTIYCSEYCKDKAKRARERERCQFKHSLSLVPKTCIVCGKTFTPTLHNSQLICSEECKRFRVNENARKTSLARNYRLKAVEKKVQSKADTVKAAHELRMQRQAEAKARGMSYGQYIALLGGELL